MYPALPKSYKGAYPFKLGTTSFIYPDHITPNIKMLGPYLDEIELLFFESQPAGMPSRQEIKEIGQLAKDFDLTYNIHLPLDISLGAPDSSKRLTALKTVKQIIDLTAPLAPSTYTLHLPYDEAEFDNQRIKRWQGHIRQSMEKLLAAGIEAESISIENLDYPLEWVEKIINDFNLAVCIDLGHLIVNQFDIQAAFNRYYQKTVIIHLYGAENRHDHLSLDKLSPVNTDIILPILKQFKKVVSLEVFSYDRLVSSLNFLEQSWQKYNRRPESIM